MQSATTLPPMSWEHMTQESRSYFRSDQMSTRILIVEDEIFVAVELENLIADMGHESVGIAPNQKAALRHAGATDVALVDLNLQDGPTGAAIGQILAQTHGVTVLFMTANPSQLGDGVPGTLGVLPKPVTERELRQAVDYAVAKRHEQQVNPPSRLKLFDWPTSEALRG
jgi:DNA-binding NtrC family response regulator